MKKILLRSALMLAVLFLVAAVAIFFSLNTIVKKGVETIGPQLAKVQVRLEAADLSPLSGNGRLKGLFVGNPEPYKTPSAIKVGDVKVAVKLSSVMSDVIVVDVVNIQSPEITFEGGLGGNNLSKILANLNAAAGNNQPVTNKSGAVKSQRKFQVKDVLVQGARVNVNITSLIGGKSATLSLPDLHLQNIGTADNGVTAAELANQILKPLLASITKAVAEGMTDIGKEVKDIGKGGAEQLNKTRKGVLDLFKKK